MYGQVLRGRAGRHKGVLLFVRTMHAAGTDSHALLLEALPPPAMPSPSYPAHLAIASVGVLEDAGVAVQLGGGGDAVGPGQRGGAVGGAVLVVLQQVGGREGERAWHWLSCQHAWLQADMFDKGAGLELACRHRHHTA